MPVDDATLVRDAAAGDRAAFGRLVDRHRGAVWGTAYHYLGSADDAQDVAQEAFVQAFLHLPQLREPERFAPWMRRITMNACAQGLRQRATLEVGLDAADGQTRGDGAERIVSRLALREALGRLSEKTRLVLTLCCTGGYSHAEVADYLDIPVGTVRSRLQRAKQQMRKEMVAMYSDEVASVLPDEQFTRRVVEEALERATKAIEAWRKGEAIEHYDAALAAAEGLSSGEDRLRFQYEALSGKSWLAQSVRTPAEASDLALSALAAAEELGDRVATAKALVQVGLCQRGGSATDWFEKGLAVYRELGDAGGQAECLMWLGGRSLCGGAPAAARARYEEAAPLFKQVGELAYFGVCRAALSLLDEPGEGMLASPIRVSAACVVLRREGAKTVVHGIPGLVHTEQDESIPPAMTISGVFDQAARSHTVVDEDAPTGHRRTGEAQSGCLQPLRAVVTVLSRSETVETPAGTFRDCMLIEHVTSADWEIPADLPAWKREQVLAGSGSRRAWIAPGVGVVRVQVRTGAGIEAAIHLTEYAIAGDADRYLPLAVGNRWVYGMEHLSHDYVAKETYRVVAREGSLWFLESPSFQLRKP